MGTEADRETKRFTGMGRRTIIERYSCTPNSANRRLEEAEEYLNRGGVSSPFACLKLELRICAPYYIPHFAYCNIVHFVRVT